MAHHSLHVSPFRHSHGPGWALWVDELPVLWARALADLLAIAREVAP